MVRRIASTELKPLMQGLAFPESPRWQDGALWCSDIADGKVLRIGGDGAATVVADGFLGAVTIGPVPARVGGTVPRHIRNDGHAGCGMAAGAG